MSTSSHDCLMNLLSTCTGSQYPDNLLMTIIGKRNYEEIKNDFPMSESQAFFTKIIQAAEKAIKYMPQRRQDVINFLFREGKSLEDAMAKWNISETTILNHLSSFRKEMNIAISGIIPPRLPYQFSVFKMYEKANGKSDWLQIKGDPDKTAEIMKIVDEAVYNLAENERKVFLYIYKDNLNRKEVGDELEITTPRVRQILVKSNEKVVEFMVEHYNQDNISQNLK